MGGSGFAGAGLTAALLCASAGAVFGPPPAVAAVEDSLRYDVRAVLADVELTYARVQAARGRIERVVQVSDGVADTVQGRFAVQKPERLLVELVGDTRQVVAYDGQRFRAYLPEQKRGVYRAAGDLSPTERFALGPAPFFGNVLTLVGTGFALAVADTAGGEVIVKAVPEHPLQFGFILVAVDPQTWTVRSIEQFDRSNRLVSQTRFLAFEVVGDSLFFPTVTQTSTVTERGVLTETTRLSRVQLNPALTPDELQIAADPQATWSPVPTTGDR